MPVGPKPGSKMKLQRGTPNSPSHEKAVISGFLRNSGTARVLGSSEVQFCPGHSSGSATPRNSPGVPPTSLFRRSVAPRQGRHAQEGGLGAGRALYGFIYTEQLLLDFYPIEKTSYTKASFTNFFEWKFLNI